MTALSIDTKNRELPTPSSQAVKLRLGRLGTVSGLKSTLVQILSPVTLWVLTFPELRSTGSFGSGLAWVKAA